MVVIGNLEKSSCGETGQNIQQYDNSSLSSSSLDSSRVCATILGEKTKKIDVGAFWCFRSVRACRPRDKYYSSVQLSKYY